AAAARACIAAARSPSTRTRWCSTSACCRCVVLRRSAPVGAPADPMLLAITAMEEMPPGQKTVAYALAVTMLVVAVELVPRRAQPGVGPVLRRAGVPHAALPAVLRPPVEDVVPPQDDRAASGPGREATRRTARALRASMSADADALAAELARAFRTRVVEECLP